MLDEGDQRRLCALLERSRALGFLGPGDIQRHVEHALALGTLVGTAARHALDLGAGGGVPGLVLAMDRPDVQWVLLDAQERRTVFLARAVDELGLGARVTVLRARAEDAGHGLAHRGRYDVVTARGFGPPGVTAECGGALLRPGGELLVSEPPEDPGRSASSRWPHEPLEQIGLRFEPVVAGGYRFARLTRIGPWPVDLPRRPGRPGKRPLF